MRNIGKILKKIRLGKGITQAELAKKLETAQSKVARWESTDWPKLSIQKIEKIANALCIPANEIFKNFTKDEKK